MTETTDSAGDMDRDFVQSVEDGGQADVVAMKEEKFAEGDERLTQVKELLEDDAKDDGFEVVTVNAESLPAESGDHDDKYGEADRAEAGITQASKQDKSTAKIVNEVAVEKDEGGSKTRERKASSREREENAEESDSDSSEESGTSEGETGTDESESSSGSETEKVRKKKKQDGDSKVTAQKDDNGDAWTTIDSTALQAETDRSAAVRTDEPATSTVRRRKRKSREEVKDEEETKEKKKSRPQQRDPRLDEETNLPVILVAVTCCFALVLYCVCSFHMAKNERKVGGRTPLHTAAQKGDVTRLLRLLAPKDIDINKQDTMGDTALMLAIRNKKEDAAILLLSEGASHWLFNLMGEAAIHEAATNGLDVLIPNLMKYGADPELQSRDGWTPLMKAVKADELGTVRALLEKGNANPNTKSDSGGLSPLHLAAQKNPSLVSVLAKAGGNVNAKDEIFGLTPLHVAAGECNALTTRELLKRGADDWQEANDGTRPRHVIGKKVHKGHAKNAQCDTVKRLLMG